jgi:hypothetical protein
MVWVLGVMMIVGLSAKAMAQPSGNIRGVITDAASGQILPGVTVMVNINPTIGTTTNGQGVFNLLPLPVGRYNIQAS